MLPDTIQHTSTTSNTDARRYSRLASVFVCIFLAVAGCVPAPTPAVFIAPPNVTPTSRPTLPAATSVAATPTAITEAATPTQSAACENDLTFMQDLTVPDGSVIPAGGSIDKQWLVLNSGTCNWDADYRLKMVAGEALGALTEQALYPAKAGTQAALRLLFTAPIEPGTYQSAWQAFAPDGSIFGDAVFIEIIVSE